MCVCVVQCLLSLEIDGMNQVKILDKAVCVLLWAIAFVKEQWHVPSLLDMDK